MPGRPSLLWIAVAETIWAEDMEAMLWRALSFTAWSLMAATKGLSTRSGKTGGWGVGGCWGSINQNLNYTLKAPLTSLTALSSKQIKRSTSGIAMLRTDTLFLRYVLNNSFQIPIYDSREWYAVELNFTWCLIFHKNTFKMLIHHHSSQGCICLYVKTHHT